jgi:hypothetical protein
MAGATEQRASNLALMTADEFARRPDAGFPEELVEGKVEAMTPSRPYHGHV